MKTAETFDVRPWKTTFRRARAFRVRSEPPLGSARPETHEKRAHISGSETTFYFVGSVSLVCYYVSKPSLLCL